MRKPDWIYRGALKWIWVLDEDEEVIIKSIAVKANDEVVVMVVDRHWRTTTMPDEDAKHRLRKLRLREIDKEKEAARRENIAQMQLGF